MIWTVISIYALYSLFKPEGGIIDFLGLIGSLMAGGGTITLAWFAKKAIGEWQKQLGATYSHDCIFKAREAAINHGIITHQICEQLLGNAHLLCGKIEDTEEYRKFCTNIQMLREKHQKSHLALFVSLIYLSELSDKKHLTEETEIRKFSKGIGYVCDHILFEGVSFDLAKLCSSDIGIETGIKNIFLTTELDGKPADRNIYSEQSIKSLQFVYGYSTSIAKYGCSDFRENNTH